MTQDDCRNRIMRERTIFHCVTLIDRSAAIINFKLYFIQRDVLFSRTSCHKCLFTERVSRSEDDLPLCILVVHTFGAWLAATWSKSRGVTASPLSNVSHTCAFASHCKWDKVKRHLYNSLLLLSLAEESDEPQVKIAITNYLLFRFSKRGRNNHMKASSDWVLRT